MCQEKTKNHCRPRQVTTIKDAAFGLGYHPRKTAAMAAAVVDLVASKPRHAGRCGPYNKNADRDHISLTLNNSHDNGVFASTFNGGTKSVDTSLI